MMESGLRLGEDYLKDHTKMLSCEVDGVLIAHALISLQIPTHELLFLKVPTYDEQEAPRSPNI